MDNSYFIERLLVTILMFLIAAVLFFISKQIVSKTKYLGRVKFFLTIIVTCILSLMIFYSFAIIDNKFGFGNKYLTGMALVFIPISFLLLVIFTILFFVKR